MDKELLVIEDEKFVNAYLKEKLEGIGYRVHTALNGKEALKAVKNSTPDLIVTDVVMPIMDGITFCRELQKNEQLCDIPVIVSTSWTNKEPVLHQCGIQNIIYKPYDIKDLNEMIHQIFEPTKKLTISKKVLAISDMFHPIKKVISELTSDGWPIDFQFLEVTGSKESLIKDLSYIKMDLILIDNNINFLNSQEMIRDVLKLSQNYDIPVVIYNKGEEPEGAHNPDIEAQVIRKKGIIIDKLNKANLALVMVRLFPRA